MPSSRFTIAVFLSLLVFALTMVGYLFWPLVTPIILALVLVSIFHPWFVWVKSLVGGSRIAAAFVMTLVIFVCVMLPLALLVTLLSEQARVFYEGVSSTVYLQYVVDVLQGNHPLILRFRDYLSHFGLDLADMKIANSSAELVRTAGQLLYQNLNAIISNAVSLLVDFTVMMVMIFAFFATGDQLKAYLMDAAPLPHNEKERLVYQFQGISHAVFFGNAVICMLEGFLGGLGMYYFDLGPGLLWGVVIAFAALLPVVGIFVVVLPAALVLYLDGSVLPAFIFIGYNVLYLTVLEWLVKPSVIGGRTRMHALLVFFAVFAGMRGFGILGLFYGPLILTMALSLIDIYKEHYRGMLQQRFFE